MASAAKPVEAGRIGNQTNFCKYVLLIMEPCSEAFFYAYKWLYSWDQSKPADLEDHLEKIPKYSTEKKLTKYFKKDEKDKIQAMKGNINVLKGFDISLLYKVSLHANSFFFLLICFILKLCSIQI